VYLMERLGGFVIGGGLHGKGKKNHGTRKEKKPMTLKNPRWELADVGNAYYGGAQEEGNLKREKGKGGGGKKAFSLNLKW